MLGIPDFQVSLAYALCILSALACVVYGIINWNKEGDDVPEPLPPDEAKWAEDENKIDKSMA
jgi:hypothetical protein